MTSVDELDQLKKQNALLLRTLLRTQRERDALAQQIAKLQASNPATTTTQSDDDVAE